MEEVHKSKSKQKRKHSLVDNENDTACVENDGNTPKTKKKKISEMMNTDSSNPDVESINIPRVKSHKKRSRDKDKDNEKDKTVDEITTEIQEGDATKITRKKKSKEKDQDKENNSLKQGIVETNGGEQMKMTSNEIFESGEGASPDVKGKRKSKKNSKGKGSLGTDDHNLVGGSTLNNLQTTSLDGTKMCVAEAKTGSDEIKGDETTGKKSKKKKAKDQAKNSLGSVDFKLVESTAKNLQVNGIDVSNTESSREDDIKKSSSSEKQKKKKKKKKINKQAGKTDDKKSDQNPISRCDRALNYLHLWNLEKASWKFNKRMQIQLLHMMYDTSRMSDDDFQILLLYLADMKGLAREVTHNQAMKLVNADTENGEDVSRIKEQRAREIVQVLS